MRYRCKEKFRQPQNLGEFKHLVQRISKITKKTAEPFNKGAPRDGWYIVEIFDGLPSDIDVCKAEGIFLERWGD